MCGNAPFLCPKTEISIRSWAVENGHEAVVKLPVESGADVELPRTPVIAKMEYLL